MSYRSVLRELGFDSHGIVTLVEAESAGVPAVEVRKLASRGALIRLGQGVYRMAEVPPGPLDEFAAAVALVGADAVLADESALAAYDLGQINVRRIKVATTARVRKRLPPTVQIVRKHVPPHLRADIEGIASMRVGAAALACRGKVMETRLVDAMNVAAARGLIDHNEAQRVLSELEAADGWSGAEASR
ncbi:type IV toxin-antitoxin system AbiEi family antitoxin domain-containing protein [Nocardioides sp. NPDC127514]|uniref:type IV toxin-antitoxin system AbiEi family antitoxin domain-containing protein n=1 Tax=unclassified Nocardioides TaxID=2615069 RepID=UPI003320D033